MKSKKQTTFVLNVALKTGSVYGFVFKSGGVPACSLLSARKALADVSNASRNM